MFRSLACKEILHEIWQSYQLVEEVWKSCFIVIKFFSVQQSRGNAPYLAIGVWGCHFDTCGLGVWAAVTSWKNAIRHQQPQFWQPLNVLTCCNIYRNTISICQCRGNLHRSNPIQIAHNIALRHAFFSWTFLRVASVGSFLIALNLAVDLSKID
jgi:hypothetical protein